MMAEYLRKITNGRKIAGAIRSPVNARGLQLECSRELHKELLVPVSVVWQWENHMQRKGEVWY